MVEWLPHINASLNSVALLLLLTGLWYIRHGQEASHRRSMLAAFGASILFLASYLVYHAQVGSQKLPETIQGAYRTGYYALLISHIILAALVPFLATATIYLALRDRRPAHRALAKITLPIWLYVSVTGVTVYVILYWLV